MHTMTEIPLVEHEHFETCSNRLHHNRHTRKSTPNQRATPNRINSSSGTKEIPICRSSQSKRHKSRRIDRKSKIALSQRMETTEIAPNRPKIPISQIQGIESTEIAPNRPIISPCAQPSKNPQIDRHRVESIKSQPVRFPESIETRPDKAVRPRSIDTAIRSCAGI